MKPTISRFLLVLTFACLVACGTTKTAAPPSETVSRIIIEKSAHTRTLMHGDEVVKSYKVALSREPVGAKERQGDHKVPEGDYVIDAKKPNSRFHMALHISYPNASDSARAHSLGVNPGGDVEIHGVESAFSWLGGLQRHVDWTDGCIAVSDSEIEEIWPLVPVGTPIEIRP